MTIREQAIEYIQAVILPICSYPIVVQDEINERGLCITIQAHDDDAAFLIGRKGSVALSLKNILHVWGSKHNASVKLNILGTNPPKR